MKNVMISALTLLIGVAGTSSGQNLDLSPIYLDKANGRIGFNTSSPVAPLHIRGNPRQGFPWSQMYLEPSSTGRAGAIVMKSTFDNTHANWYIGPGSGAPQHNNFRFYLFGGNYSPGAVGGNKMLITLNGDVGIGTTGNIYGTTLGGAIMRVLATDSGKVAIGRDDMSRAGDYGLYVEKGVLTSKLKVAEVNSTDWADYVFEDDYQLRSLDEVEQFIRQHRHLPGLPSAQDVARDGIDVAKMDGKLLEKIEELTLYLIDLKKENELLKQEVNLLKSNTQELGQ